MDDDVPGIAPFKAILKVMLLFCADEVLQNVLDSSTFDHLLIS